MIFGRYWRQLIAPSFWWRSASSYHAWVDVTCARKPDALRAVAGGDLRPPGTSVFDESRPRQVKPHAQMGRCAVPKTHDLEDLLDLLLTHDATLAPLRRAIRSLTRYAAAFRFWACEPRRGGCRRPFAKPSASAGNCALGSGCRREPRPNRRLPPSSVTRESNSGRRRTPRP